MKECKKDIPNQIVKYRKMDLNIAHQYAVQSRADIIYGSDDINKLTKGSWSTNKTFKLRQSAIDYFKSQMKWNYFDWAKTIHPNRYFNIEFRIIKAQQTELFKRYYASVKNK